MNDAVVSASLLSVTQSVGVFTTVLPPFAEVRKTVGDPGVTNDVRMGEAVASALVISIGLIASAMVKDPAPAMIAIVAAGGMVVMYESILRQTPKESMP